MSYEILYAKKFIKLPDNTFIPLVLSGSNNCSMFVNGREVAERHWWILGGLLGKTEEEMLGWAKSLDYSNGCEWFKQGSDWLVGDDILHFLSNGAKRASTLEEVFEANRGVTLSASVSIYDNTKKYAEEGYQRNEAERYFIKTTEELMEWIKEARELKKGKKDNEQIYFNLEFSSLKPLKSNFVPKNIEGPVICSVTKGKYLTDYSDRSYSFCSRVEEAIVFEDTDAFMASGLAARIGGHKLMSASIKEKKKDFFIAVTDGSFAGYLIKKLSSRNVYFTSYPDTAKRFEREKEAQDYIEKKLKGRFKGAKEFEVRKVEVKE